MAFVFGIAAIIAIPLGIRAWMEAQIDKTVEAKMRSVLSDETILRKIAAESRPSLLFDATGSILHDMGAVPYLKPDDIRVVKRDSDGPPLIIHIGFVRPVSYPPLVTPLHDSAVVTAANGKGLDWEFTINWPDKQIGLCHNRKWRNTCFCQPESGRSDQQVVAGRNAV